MKLSKLYCFLYLWMLVIEDDFFGITTPFFSVEVYDWHAEIAWSRLIRCIRVYTGPRWLFENGQYAYDTCFLYSKDYLKANYEISLMDFKRNNLTKSHFIYGNR